MKSSRHFFKSMFLLTLPGNGIHTVHTGSERKSALWHSYYGTDYLTQAMKLWRQQVKKNFSVNNRSSNRFNLLGVPSDIGAGLIRGSNWGPLVLRGELVSSDPTWKLVDVGDLKIQPHMLHDQDLTSSAKKKIGAALYGDLKITMKEKGKLPISALSQLEFFCSEYFKFFSAPLMVLGGDHSITWPIIKGILKNLLPQEKKEFAIIHFDAHTDLLATRLGSEYCFGTWAYHASQALHSPKHLLQMGIRSSGKTKKYWEKTIGVKQWWSEEIIAGDLSVWMDAVVQHLKKLNIKKIYISLDVDVFGPEYVSCTGTAEAQGLAPFHFIQLIERLKKIPDEFEIVGIDIVEFAPFVRSPLCATSQPEPMTSLLSLATVLNFLKNILETQDNAKNGAKK